jgi:hypothetical protein
MLSFFCTMQMQQKNMVEPSLDQTEKLMQWKPSRPATPAPNAASVTWQERHW